MSAHRFFLAGALPAGAADGSEAGDAASAVELPLSPEDVHHATSVLRIAPAEKIEVVEPDGAVWLAEVVEALPERVSARVLSQLAASDAGPDVVLVQGVAKGEKMDDIVRHAVEIGASAVVPFVAERSIVRMDAAKRAARGERWRRIATSAAKQAHAARVPQVHDPAGVAEAVAAVAGCDRVVVLWEDAGDGAPGVAQALAGLRAADGARVAVVVGPEGGLSPAEVAAFTDAGAVTATLGANVLRTQTAALVALALAVHELGGLGNAR